MCGTQNTADLEETATIRLVQLDSARAGEFYLDVIEVIAGKYRWPPTPVVEGRWMGAVSVKPRYLRRVLINRPVVSAFGQTDIEPTSPNGQV